MATRVGLDWDLCAACFSFDAQDTVTRRALSKVLKSSYNHDDDTEKQREDIKKVGAYMSGPLKSFLHKFSGRIDIVTANAEANVRQLCVYFGLPQPENVVSIFDNKATEFNRQHGTDISANLFAAATEYMKKVPNAKKPEQVAKKFHVSVQSITQLLHSHSVAIQNIDASITKAAHFKAQRTPFIFLDDARSEIRSVERLFSTAPANLFNAVADFIETDGTLEQVAHKHKISVAQITAALETYPEITDILQRVTNGAILFDKAVIVPIPRPGRHSPVEDCGMFSEKARALLKRYGKSSWEQFMEEKISILDIESVHAHTVGISHFRTLVQSGHKRK